MDDVDTNDKLIQNIDKDKYFKLPRRLLQFIGLWPFQTNSRIFFNIVTALPFLICLSASIKGTTRWCGYDIDLCSENIMGGLFATSVFIKFVITLASRNKLKVVIEKITENWITLTDFQERKIIIKFAELGRIKAFVYFVYICITGLTFALSPAFIKIINLINPLNETIPRRLILRADWLVDEDKYFYEIHAVMCSVVVVSTLVTTGIDCMYTMIAHQNLALLALVRRRLHEATKTVNIRTNRDYKMLVEAIRLHKESVEFTDMIETTYSLFFFFMSIVTVLMMSVGAIMTIKVLHDNDYVTLSRIITIEIGTLIHFFYLTWPGQLLLNESENLFSATYTNEWYNLSQRGKTILRMMMLRLTKPSRITAGGILEMNFLNYGLLIKNAASYLTVALSFQN